MRQLTIILAASALLMASIAEAQVRPPTWPMTAESGHQALSSAVGGCAHTWVDIAATGTPLALTAAGSDPAADDGGAVLTLPAPFQFFDRVVTAMVVSSNGYLAFTNSLDRDSGGDFSEDCPLPAVPHPGPAVSPRILVLHDDLDGSSSGGQIVYQDAPVCPRPSEALGNEPCIVISWLDWSIPGGADTFSLQAILYLTSSQIVTSVQASTAIPSGTAGLQSHRAEVALAPGCNGGGYVAGGSSLCYFDPRYPADGPQSDLVVEVSADRDTVAPGESMQVYVEVLNLGPSPVQGASVASSVDETLVCTTTCAAGSGSACDAGPVAGVPGGLVDLNPGSVLEFTMTCSVGFDVVPPIAVHASVAPPPSLTDPDTANNLRSISVAIPGFLFADGFETGSTVRWSSAP
jgi:hypothetical protein